MRVTLTGHLPEKGLAGNDIAAYTCPSSQSVVACVVVHVLLVCCRCQDSQPLPSITPPRPGRTIRPDAQYRWQLLRLAVKFHMAYRCVVIAGWLAGWWQRSGSSSCSRMVFLHCIQQADMYVCCVRWLFVCRRSFVLCCGMSH
jgi:hypothetical protein